MKGQRLFAVDGNWILHRVFYTIKYEVKDLSRTMQYRFLSRVCQDAIAVRANSIVVAFDGSKIFRYDLFPEYKGHRGDSDEVYAHLPAVKAFLAEACIPVVQRKRFEADDVLRSIAHRFRDYDIVIGARDKDTYQYLRPGVRLYDSAFRVNGELRPRYVTADDVQAIMGVPPHLAMEYQVLIGDGTDGVEKIITPAKARKGLLAHGSIAAWCRADPDMAKVFQTHRDQFVLNKQMVMLRDDALPEHLDVTFKRSTSTRLTENYYAFADMAKPRSKGLF